MKENPRARKNLACNGRSSADITEADFIDKDVNDSSPKHTGEEDPQNIFLEKGCVNDKVLITDSHPPKKPKITADGVLDVFETTNGLKIDIYYVRYASNIFYSSSSLSPSTWYPIGYWGHGP